MIPSALAIPMKFQSLSWTIERDLSMMIVLSDHILK
jgi:hypothetical protein